MPLRIKCPSGHSLIVSESRAGQTFRCPKCSREVKVPGEPPQPAIQTAAKKPESAEPKQKPASSPADSLQKKERWRSEQAQAGSPPPIPGAPTKLAKAVEPPPVTGKASTEYSVLSTDPQPPPVLVPPPLPQVMQREVRTQDSAPGTQQEPAPPPKIVPAMETPPVNTVPKGPAAAIESAQERSLSEETLLPS